MGTINSESRQVKTLAFNIPRRIIIRNSLCERFPITGNDAAVKGKKRMQFTRINALWICFRSAKLIAEQCA